MGSKINERYELIEFIAPGGMGEVWKAIDHTLTRNIAIKMVNGNYLKQNPSAADILLDEAKAGASLLGHPNVVSIIDFGSFQISNVLNYFIVMELVDGINVNRWIEEYKPLIDKTTYYNISLFIALEVCRAVAYAHRKGILHRDIKPLNIFLSKFGLIKVGDFGLARFIEAVTRSHTVWDLGTPSYTAPEQWKGEKATKETDIYQLGCTLYHLFTGKPPFEKNSGAALMYAHLNDNPTAPHFVSDIIPQDLSEQLLKLLDKEPNKRCSLWEINDKLADQIQRKFTMEGNFHLLSDAQKEKVNEITELEINAKTPTKFTFPDFSEILSESIELILEGITDLKITSEET
ncbi:MULTISPECIES: serine/threonine-protein kinase [unclassified Paenibacillus]|uniref:serine/threonine protein kinase n=1 Tax=unclassified Paenibacillus TaxID=185978 RepID=UPI002406A1D3|nr:MULTISPECIES: serine/threonine-protein kinase [unclassified Paenibacillus]